MIGALQTQPHVRRTSLLVAGFICLLIAGGVWFVSIQRERAAGRELAAQYPNNDAAKTIFTLSTEARAAFLRALFENVSARTDLHEYEHQLAVALTQVRTSEARAIYRKAILPAIESSADAAVLRLCFSLLNRWDTMQALSDRELARLGSVFEERLLQDPSAERLEALANGFSLSAAETRFQVSRNFLDQLLQRIRAERDNEARTPLFSALIAVESRLTPQQADALALQAMSLINGPLDSASFAAWGAVLRALKLRLEPAKATQLMDTVVTRLTTEQRPDALRILASIAAAPGTESASQSLSKWAALLADGIAQQIGPNRQSAMLTAFVPLAPELARKEVASLSEQLLERLEIEFIPDSSAIVAEALASFGAAIPADAANRASAHLIGQMKAAHDAKESSQFAGALAVLKNRVPTSRYQEAARMVQARLVPGISGQDATMLITVLEALAAQAPGDSLPDTVEQLARRMNGEANPGVHLWLAKGILDLSPKLNAEATGPIAASLARQLPGEASAVGLRALCFALGALPKTVTVTQRHNAAVLVGQRLDQTNDAGALKDLTAALLALGTGIGDVRADIVAQAAPKLAGKIVTEPDVGALENLTATLAALRPGNDDDNAADDDRPPAKQGNGGEHDVSWQEAARQKAAWQKASHEAVRALLHRIFAAPDAASMGILAPALRSLTPLLEAGEAAELAAQLISRIEGEASAEGRRILGEMLTAWPDGSLTKADLTRLPRLFEGKSAPCAVVLRVAGAELQSAIVAQLLNPFCAEAAWIMQVTELGNMTRRKLVLGKLGGAGKRSNADDADDFHQLLASDDEDDLVEDGSGAEVDVDFNQLSGALDATRSPAAKWWEEQWPLASLAVLGVALCSMGLWGRSAA
ncbi:MAG: hypothetical protein ABL967_01400 [Bryobacteraceae bacterium]